MSPESERARLRSAILEFMPRSIESPDEKALGALLDDVAEWQARHVPPYARLVAARGIGAALPTDVFRHARVAAHPLSQDVAVFRTSGTTASPGEHFFRSLELYETAARLWASQLLFPSDVRMRFVLMDTPRPGSSLAHMVWSFTDWFSAGDSSQVTPCDPNSAAEVAQTIEAAAGDGPVCLLGTSFAFVFAEEALRESGASFQLPEGSRIMHTGGFKGRTREVEPAHMIEQLAARYGVAENHVVAEYGMTELSSQAYETTLTEPNTPRRLKFPPWVRATAVDPATLEPTGDAPGILRLEDLANLDSCCRIQTADMARREGDGWVLLGRAPGAVPRGCSLATESALA